MSHKVLPQLTQRQQHIRDIIITSQYNNIYIYGDTRTGKTTTLACSIHRIHEQCVTIYLDSKASLTALHVKSKLNEHKRNLHKCLLYIMTTYDGFTPIEWENIKRPSRFIIISEHAPTTDIERHCVCIQLQEIFKHT